jgi:riboflavin synthase
MFTGLVIETGEIASVRVRDGKTRITISAKNIPVELKTGDSVAVSGVCLTAVEISRKQFSADLAEETLKRTSLGSLKKNSLVNLELPARAQDRLGGHVVQGHVDAVGKLLDLKKIKGGEDWRMMLELPSGLERYVVPQGSITVEGISLTVAKIEGNRLEIAVIPHTYEVTNLRELRSGSPVNIEVDILAKYAEKRNGRRLTVAELVAWGF